MLRTSLRVRIQFFPWAYEVGLSSQLFHVFCSLHFSYYSFSSGSTKEPFKVLTSRRLPQLTLITYYYYYAAWCLIKKTILRLWLERMERRTESEGKEWVSMFPGGVKTENERGETREWAALWGCSQPRLCLNFCTIYPTTQHGVWIPTHASALWHKSSGNKDATRERSGWFVLVPPPESQQQAKEQLYCMYYCSCVCACKCVLIFECVLRGLRWGQLSPPSPALHGVLAPPGMEKNECVKVTKRQWTSTADRAKF